MNKGKPDLVDKITSQYIESIAQEIAKHPHILGQAIRRNDATKLQKAYVPLLRLHWKVKAEINTDSVKDSNELQKP